MARWAKDCLSGAGGHPGSAPGPGRSTACWGAPELVQHNCWACALEPRSYSCWNLRALEPMLLCSEEKLPKRAAGAGAGEQPSLSATRNTHITTKTLTQPPKDKGMILSQRKQTFSVNWSIQDWNLTGAWSMGETAVLTCVKTKVRVKFAQEFQPVFVFIYLRAFIS